MAEIPHQWDAYARVQTRLSTTDSIVYGRALEDALNIIHQPDFTADEAKLLRLANNAARKERHQGALRQQALDAALEEATAGMLSDEGDISTGPASLDSAIHARRELQRISECVSESDWDLLTDIATGVPYGEMAIQLSSTPTALRSRVCRLRSVIGTA